MDEHTRPDLRSITLITIDCQRDFLDIGRFALPGTSAVLPAIGRLLDAFRRTGRPIVHVVRLYREDGSDAELCRRTLFKSSGGAVVPGSMGSQLAEELLAEPQQRLDPQHLLAGAVQKLGPREAAIYKPRWGAFYETPIHQHLETLAATTLAFTGFNFPNCPRASIYEASERDYRVVVCPDALSLFDERAAAEMRGIGAVLMTSAELVARLEDVVPAD